ncbi:MAG: hypothetical protein WD069_22540 [Planctomycetales bacterium]
MSRSRSTGSVSLFPFLAVLVCAMGALIFLLLVTTRQIRSDALARAQDAPPTPPAPVGQTSLSVRPEAPRSSGGRLESLPHVPDPNVELRAKLAHLDDATAAERAELARRQAELRAVLDEARRLDAESRSAEERVRQVAAERVDQADALSKLVGAQRAIAGEIRGLSGRIATVRQQSAQASSRFAFVPYDGRSGTARRPILIECNERGLRFVPEGVEISEQDLEGFLVEFNPLLAGAEGLGEYWGMRDRLAGDPREPYFLLIVRPGGARAFYVAQKILGRMGDRLGYELLTDDFPLAVPEVDPRAQEVCRNAVERLLAERERLLGSIVEGRGPMAGANVIRGGSGTSSTGEGSSGQRGPVGWGGGPSAPAPISNGRGTGASGRGDGGDDVAIGGPLRNPPDFRPSAFDGEGRGRGPAGNRPTDRTTVEAPSGSQRADRVFPLDPRDGPRRTGEWTAGARLASPGTASAAGTPRNGDRGGQSGSEGGAADNRDGDPVGPPAFGRSQPDSSARGGGPSPKWGGFARRGTIGLEKEVLVEVLPDRLIVGRELLVPANPESSAKEITDDLIEAVERHVASWGEAPATFYWSPRVRFRVGQGANRQYERVRGPVERLGISTTAEFVLETEQGGKAR